MAGRLPSACILWKPSSSALELTLPSIAMRTVMPLGVKVRNIYFVPRLSSSIVYWANPVVLNPVVAAARPCGTGNRRWC